MKNGKLLTVAGVTLITASVALAGYNPESRSQERQDSIQGNDATATMHETDGMGHMHNSGAMGSMHADHQMGTMHANAGSHHMATTESHCGPAGKRHHGQAQHGAMMDNGDHGSAHHNHMAANNETDETVMPMHNRD